MSHESARYLFIHVPKTAGTSVITVLRTLFGVQEVMEAADSNFDNLDLEALAGYRVLAGHFKWDQVTHFPDRRLFTFLREPIDLVVSKYYYMRNMADPIQPTTELCKRRSLEEILWDDGVETTQFRNATVRQLAGVGPGVRHLGHEAFNRAVSMLHRCDFVGISEDFEESLDVMSYTFAWPLVEVVPRDNVTQGRPPLAEVDRSLIERIRVLNELDLHLYQHARELFHARKRDAIRAAAQCRAAGGNLAAAGRVPVQAVAMQRPLGHEGPVSADDPCARMRIVAMGVQGPSAGTAVFRSGDSVTVTITAIANTTIRNVAFKLFVYNRFHQLQFSSSTDRHAPPFTMQQQALFRASFKMKMSLACGWYQVSAAANAEVDGMRRWLDHLQDGARFELEGLAQGEFGGIVDLDPSISLWPDPELAQPYALGDEIWFTAEGNSDRYAMHGWAVPEDWGRWTVGEEAHLLIAINLLPDHDVTMTAAVLTMCPPQRPDIAVDVLVNGQTIDTWSFHEPDSTEERSTRVEAGALRPITHVMFRIREPLVPEDLGLSTDTRALGLGMIRLRLSDPYSDLNG